MHKNNLDFEKFKPYFLSLEPLEQAGFFLWPSLGGYELTQKEIELLKQIKPSGLIFFKRNFSSMEQAKNLISEVRKIVEDKKEDFFKPLMTSIDEEGGRVSRLPLENIRGKSALEFANSQNKLGLLEQVLKQCRAAKEIGVNCLLAPVADILTEPQNQVMGDRCFGTSETTVSEYAALVNEVILGEDLFSCAKHFPGHGNTTTDSHKEFSMSAVSLEQLKSREWLPFKKLIQEGVPFIMAAHVLLPEVDAQYPATLSHQILTKQLREELGFEGLILSDDLRMNAVALHYKVTKAQDSSITEEVSVTDSKNEKDFYLRQAAIDALNAGCDILLSCQSIEKERIIAESLSQHLQSNEHFRENMVKKAWRIYSQLSKKERILP